MKMSFIPLGAVSVIHFTIHIRKVKRTLKIIPPIGSTLVFNIKY